MVTWYGKNRCIFPFHEMFVSSHASSRRLRTKSCRAGINFRAEIIYFHVRHVLKEILDSSRNNTFLFLSLFFSSQGRIDTLFCRLSIFEEWKKQRRRKARYFSTVLWPRNWGRKLFRALKNGALKKFRFAVRFLIFQIYSRRTPRVKKYSHKEIA